MSSSTPSGSSEQQDIGGGLPDRRLLHWGRPILAVVVVLIVAGIVDLLVHANIDYSFVPTYFTSDVMLHAVLRTIELAVVAQASGIVIGGIVAGMRVSQNPVASWVAAFYTWLFRAIPALVQLLLWYNLALVVKTLEVPIPFTHVFLFKVDTNTVITTFTAAWIGLTLNESAYMSEIIRAGLLGVNRGQREAAFALGMSPVQAARRVIVPQALRTVVPPTFNDFINMIKETSLASVISYIELTEAASKVSSANLEIIPALFAASIWYIILVTVATGIQRVIEQKVGRGHERTAHGGLFSSMRSALSLLPALKR
jgi:polar amino acid transport system permease protein